MSWAFLGAVGDSRYRTPLSREQHSRAQPLPLLLPSGAVPSTDAASRGCLRAESREPRPHPAPRTDRARPRGTAGPGVAPRPALPGPQNGAAGPCACTTVPEGELGGREIGGDSPSAPDGTARHRPLPQWRKAAACPAWAVAGRGLREGPRLEVAALTPHPGGCSRAQPDRRSRCQAKMAYPGQPAPGGFYQGGVSGAGARGGWGRRPAGSGESRLRRGLPGTPLRQEGPQAPARGAPEGEGREEAQPPQGCRGESRCWGCHFYFHLISVI